MGKLEKGRGGRGRRRTTNGRRRRKRRGWAVVLLNSHPPHSSSPRPPPQPFRPHRYPTSSPPAAAAAAAAAAASVVLLLFPLLFTDLAFPLRLSPSFDLRSPPRRLPIFFWLGDLWDPSMPKRGGGGGGGGRRDELKEEMPVDDAGGEEEEQLGAGGGGGAGGEDDKKKLPTSSSGVATQASVAARGRGGGSGGGGGGGGLSSPSCQAERCTADLTEAKRYHRRHKVCEAHSKAAVVMVAGIRQRFCQQCSRFHELSEFDEAKRSCRRRLAGHNERRRKSSTDPQAEGSNRCRQVDQNGRMQITLPANPTYKHFQIR